MDTDAMTTGELLASARRTAEDRPNSLLAHRVLKIAGIAHGLQQQLEDLEQQVRELEEERGIRRRPDLRVVDDGEDS